MTSVWPGWVAVCDVNIHYVSADMWCLWLQIWTFISRDCQYRLPSVSAEYCRWSLRRMADFGDTAPMTYTPKLGRYWFVDLFAWAFPVSVYFLVVMVDAVLRSQRCRINYYVTVSDNSYLPHLSLDPPPAPKVRLVSPQSAWQCIHKFISINC